jgi:Asp-tRNA(Asn)/Glu-tRNA(Gln) amidotransferase A subunit family amidase
MKLHENTAVVLSQLLAKKEVSAIEVTQSFLNRIGDLDPLLKALLP